MNFTVQRPPLAHLEQQARWLALLVVAVGLHIFEASLPSLGPWFKPGLANLVTLLVLFWMGARAAIAIALGRVLVGSFFIGTLFTPTVLVAFIAALVAALVMIICWRMVPGISLVGVSLMGALAHMLTQFVTVEQLFIQQGVLYYVLPPLLLLAVITGWINGVLASYISARLSYDISH